MKDIPLLHCPRQERLCGPVRTASKQDVWRFPENPGNKHSQALPVYPLIVLPLWDQQGFYIFSSLDGLKRFVDLRDGIVGMQPVNSRIKLGIILQKLQIGFDVLYRILRGTDQMQGIKRNFLRFNLYRAAV